MTMPKYAGGLGFRDIELFNLALLARQAWRLLQNPETLSAQILKAVYYPIGDVLTSRAGSHPSKIWRSILEGRDIMRQGLIRRIRTGESTHCWNDNWLPCGEAMRLIACLKAEQADIPMRVAELIDATIASWNTQKLEEFFLPMDIEVIRSIPINSRWHDDL
jgi:acyl-CoA synthetase (AMP-forming)/AMP-acid ligase II